MEVFSALSLFFAAMAAFIATAAGEKASKTDHSVLAESFRMNEPEICLENEFGERECDCEVILNIKCLIPKWNRDLKHDSCLKRGDLHYAMTNQCTLKGFLCTLRNAGEEAHEEPCPAVRPNIMPWTDKDLEEMGRNRKKFVLAESFRMNEPEICLENECDCEVILNKKCGLYKEPACLKKGDLYWAVTNQCTLKGALCNMKKRGEKATEVPCPAVRPNVNPWTDKDLEEMGRNRKKSVLAALFRQMNLRSHL